MIDYEQFCRIRQLRDKGLFPIQIARELSLDKRTVYKWLAEERFRPSISPTCWNNASGLPPGPGPCI